MNSHNDKYTGRHWLVEFHQVQRLDEFWFIEQCLTQAVDAVGVMSLRLELHHFGEGSGVSGVALLAKSHISIHTWPEYQYAAIDLFLCGDDTRPQAVLDVLLKAMQPGDYSVQKFERGYEAPASLLP